MYLISCSIKLVFKEAMDFLKSILPSIKIPKVKLHKKIFTFGIGRTRDSYNVSSPRDNTKFIPTISLQVHENIEENIVENNPDHVNADKQKNQINSNLEASCIHSQHNLQGGIILNIPLKANNATRLPQLQLRDMNHEKFTPCQRSFQKHENCISEHNKNIKFTKGAGPMQGDQNGTYNKDRFCNNITVKIAPPPRKKSKLRQIIQGELCKIPNQMKSTRCINHSPVKDTFTNKIAETNLTLSDVSDLTKMDVVKCNHFNPNNKSDPWTVKSDYRILEIPSTQSVQNTNCPTSATFEDEFIVNSDWSIRKVDDKRKVYKQQRTASVNIFELGNTLNVFDDFDEIFNQNQTLSSTEQLKSIYDNNQLITEVISDVPIKPFKKSYVEKNTKNVSFRSIDAHPKMKKEQTSISKYNENASLQNHGSENGFPTFEWNSGNQNIAVNHMLNQDFVESRMRNCAQNSVKCEREMFENCAIQGNENLFSSEFNLEQFWNIERNVFLDEKCLTVVLDILDSEWLRGNINEKLCEKCSNFVIKMSTSVRSDPQSHLHDMENSIIKLKLKKPGNWNWELSTSRSSPNISFPKILLYDHKNNLLAETDKSNCIINDRSYNKVNKKKSTNTKSLSFSSKSNDVSETKTPTKFDPKLNHRQSSLRSQSFHQNEFSTNSTTKQASPLKYLGCRKRSLSGSFNDMKDFLNNFTSQLKSNGIDCKITNHHTSERRHLNEIRSTNEYKHLNESNINENQLRKIKSISDINQAPKGSKQNPPEQSVLMYREQLSEKGPIQRDLKEMEFTRMSSSYKTISNFDEQKHIASKTVNGIDIFKSNVYLTGNQATPNEINRNNFLLKKSKSSMEVVSRGGDIQRNEKKKYRRAHSTNSLRFSSSILERISEFKRRSSSTDSQDSEEIENQGDNISENASTKPRYFLRTSQHSGTLVICNDSFKNKKIRRRPRSYSKINEIDEVDASVGRVKMNKNKLGFDENADMYYSLNGKDIPLERNYDNKFSHHYEKAIANIDDLIAKVVSSHQDDAMNGKLKHENNIFNKTESYPNCCCKDGKVFINDHRTEDEFNKSRSVANLIKNRDNQLDKCYSFSDNVGCVFTSDERKRRTKSLGKKDSSRNGNKNDSCENVKKDSRKVRCRSASADSERYLSSSDDDNGGDETRRGRSRRRRTQDKSLKGDQVLAVTNSLSLTQLDSDCKICDTGDQKQVLLALVRRLASLQNYSHLHYSQTHRSIDKCNPEIPNTNKDININGCSPVAQNVNDSDKKRLNGLSKSSEKTNAASLIEKNEKDKEILKQSGDSGAIDINMGSNVSRHSGKGLSGRRTRSSGDLCNENHETANGSCNTPNNKRKSENGKTNAIYEHHHHHQQHDENTAESCPVNTATKLMMAPLCVSKKDRNKFCGSLPNHLDADDVCGENAHIDNNNTLDRVEYVTVAPKKNHIPHQVESSPYHNSSSEKESTSSSTNLGSTFRTNHENKPDIQLKLPINRSNFDIGCDQGYGSERSPEEEAPQPFPPFQANSYHSMHNQRRQWEYQTQNSYDYSFITPDCCFPVQITRSERGLGLSVSGGVDTNAAFPGLIRIKRLFTHQAAWSTGMLQPGDILLDANGIVLTGLTNNEALEVLRTTSSIVTLTVCRPRDEQYRKLSPPTEPPKPPQRTHPNCLPLDPLYPIQTYYNGEFEIIMVKQQGSLGFTLRKEDESVLGHYVRALVREPATTDGRIKPGDKIIAVNDVPLCPMTHEQAVIFLRQAADKVKLRLYRDDSQTPIASMSPSNNENRSICSNSSKSKTCLRPEAINLLSDLAHKQKKNCPNPESSGSSSSFRSNTTSPRRLRRGNNKSGSSGTNTSNSENFSVRTDSNKSYIQADYIITSQPSSSVCSDSEQSTISQCSFFIQPKNTSDIPQNTTYTIPENDLSEFYAEDELWKMEDESDSSDKQNRPSYLDLAGNSGSTPVVSRKPRFQFTVAANSYELNNLNNDALDAPIYNNPILSSQQIEGDNNQNYNSLPCETFLVACKTESDLCSGNTNFNHNNPLYQSAQVQSKNNSDNFVLPKATTKSLLKWKGVMFSSDEEKETPEGDSSCAATVGTNPTPGTEKDFDFNGLTIDEDGRKIVTVELNRGWNSRLGFSLQSDSNTKNTFISAIYNDSVAARDGRLKIGDQVLMVNEDSVEDMPTSQIIDLLRIIRGSICLTVLRND